MVVGWVFGGCMVVGWGCEVVGWGFVVLVVLVRVWVSGCGLVAYVGCGRT